MDLYGTVATPIFSFITPCLSPIWQWRHNKCDGVSNPLHLDCLLNCLFRHRSKKTSNITGLCAGNSLGTSEFPAQKASNTENVSIWWNMSASSKSCEKMCYSCKKHDYIRSQFCTCHNSWAFFFNMWPVWTIKMNTEWKRFSQNFNHDLINCLWDGSRAHEYGPCNAATWSTHSRIQGVDINSPGLWMSPLRSCYLVLISIDSKTRRQDSQSSMTWPTYSISNKIYTQVHLISIWLEIYWNLLYICICK